MGLMSGKNVVIFGVANKRSIAWGIAQALHREGARLALNYQNERMEEPVRKLAADLPGDTFLAPCDVTVPGDIDRFFARLAKEFGPLDGLVHSIAFAKREELGGHFADTSWEGYAMAQQVSAWSLIGLVKGALPLMEGREAGVVCLSYYGAEKVVQNYNVMGVAKAALESSTRYLANDVGPRGVRVNAICPGVVVSELHTATGAVADYPAFLERARSTHPLGRPGQPEEIAALAAFLISDEAGWITGGLHAIDGGRTLTSLR